LRRLFIVTLFVSAALILWIQPLFGKMILPFLGGTPAVWNTCLVFFQTALLVGYLYAYFQSKWILRNQMISHLIFLACLVVLLPIQIPHSWTPPTDTNPVPALFLLLCKSLGLPFVLLSATAPLLQTWFSLSGEKQSKDPYFLYVASNVGSLVGLFAYPGLLEPHFTLKTLSWAWSGGYILLALLISATVLILWQRGGERYSQTLPSSPAIANKLRLKWLLLAAVPSSLLQSVTTYMTTDLAPVPLLWLIPLGIYFVSFVFVFSRREIVSRRLMLLLLPILLVALSFCEFWVHETDLWKMFPLVLITLFVTAMVFHGELVRTRPAADRLTEFYLWLAAGGVLGGVFSALVAPLVFTTMLEYPIVLVLAGLLMPYSDGEGKGGISFWDFVIPGAVLVIGGTALVANHRQSFPITLQTIALLGTALAIMVYLGKKRPIGFGAGLAAFLLMGFFVTHVHTHTICNERGFFGVLRVDRETHPPAMALFHGHTSHGKQFLNPRLRREPTTYYCSQGPLGEVFRSLPPAPDGRRVAVIGLGAGTIACYANKKDHWDFYEINPQVIKLAENPKYFTFLKDCPAKFNVISGDGRLSLAKAPDGYFDLIILDAFNSDSIPVHLLTTEALKLYMKKLRPNGVIAFHISNRYLNLGSVLANLAASDHIPVYAMVQILTPAEERASLAWSSAWGVVARKSGDLAQLVERYPGWRPLDKGQGADAWTDDYSSLIPYLNLSP
jgi:hypothetical protein